jgi:hypothetical protein
MEITLVTKCDKNETQKAEVRYAHLNQIPVTGQNRSDPPQNAIRKPITTFAGFSLAAEAPAQLPEAAQASTAPQQPPVTTAAPLPQGVCQPRIVRPGWSLQVWISSAAFHRQSTSRTLVDFLFGGVSLSTSTMMWSTPIY